MSTQAIKIRINGDKNNEITRNGYTSRGVYEIDGEKFYVRAGYRYTYRATKVSLDEPAIGKLTK